MLIKTAFKILLLQLLKWNNQLLFVNYDIVDKAKKNKQLHFKDTTHSSNMPTQNKFFGILDSSDFAPKSNMPSPSLICPLLV